MTTPQAALPPAYIEQMRRQLTGQEAEALIASYAAPRAVGLRLNTAKLTQETSVFRVMQEQFGLTPIPWCETGYYYNDETRPGKHPYHAAGLYYIQEPSAMTSAELLQPQPGDTVLDLAAAPGGKTTQLADMIQGQGLLVTNEIHPARARILSENVERMGIANAVVTQAAPDELSRRFPDFFDCIMLDTPCSGEGMFRKDPTAVEEWSPGHVEMCAARSADILDHAARMLKPGGRLVYSTCTFNRAENEETIEAFVEQNPDFTIERVERLWPHHERGEGHFAALLRRTESSNPAAVSSGSNSERGGKRRSSGRNSGGEADLALFRSFAADALPGMSPLTAGEPLRFGDQLYWLPHDREHRFHAGILTGLRVVRPGLHLGEIRKSRIEPSHALALHVSAEQAAWMQSYAADASEVAAYLRGETVAAEHASQGWGLIAVDGYPLGWSKASGGQAKNHLPKGLRRP